MSESKILSKKIETLSLEYTGYSPDERVDHFRAGAVAWNNHVIDDVVKYLWNKRRDTNISIAEIVDDLNALKIKP